MTVLIATIADVTIVLALGLAATAALGRRSAALRHAILAAAIVAATLSPALELLLPPLPVVPWRAAAPVVSTGLTLTSGAASVESDVMAATAPVERAVPWGLLFLAIWAIGALVTLAGLLTSLVRLARLTAACTPVLAGPWRELADDLVRAGGLRRPVTILQSADASLLVTCGLQRPKIILPAGTEAWTDDRRRSVLAHELAHIRRHDGATQLTGEILRVLHWFNPLVWLACRRLRQESEYACDDAVLGGGIEATEYATHLLDVARQTTGHRRLWAAAPAIAHPSTLERRIAAMLNRQRNRAPLTRRAQVVAMLAVTAVIVPLTAASVAPDPEPQRVLADVVLTPADLVRPSSDDVLTPGGMVRPSASATPEPEPVPAPAPSAITTPSVSPATPTAAAVAPQLDAMIFRMPPQTTTASFAGQVLDQSGGVMPGARVTLRETFSDGAVGYQDTTVTEGNGRFAFRALPPARYEMTAALPGFAPVTTILTLSAGDAAQRMITLPIGSLQETITVRCSPAGAAAAPAARRPAVNAALRPAAERLPARLARAWDRTRRAIVPVVSAQQPAPPAPVRVGGNIQPPKKLTHVSPQCPATPVAGTGTMVGLVGRVGVDGYMNDVRRIVGETGASPAAAFVESAIDAVRQWTFTPTLLNGQPVEVTITVVVLYQQP